MKNLLDFLEFQSFQEVEQHVRSVNLPRESGLQLSEVVSIVEICQLLFLLITRDVKIEQYNKSNVLVRHNFHKEKSFHELGLCSPALHNLLDKSQDSGFLILISEQYNIKEYISKMKEKKSC